MQTSKKLAYIAACCFSVGLVCTTATAAPPRASAQAQKTFDRPAIHMQLKQMLSAKVAKFVERRSEPSTEMRVKMCREQRDNLKSALAQCISTNSDPITPAPGSPLDAFNKLTSAQLAQKCPGSLQQCLDQVLNEQIAWCKANVCKSQADAVATKEAECAKLVEQALQEQSQPPPLKKNTPPCPTLYQAYLKAVEAVKNFKCGATGAAAMGCVSPLLNLKNEEKAALQKLKDNGCI